MRFRRITYWNIWFNCRLFGRWFFTLATALLTYLALLEFFRMAELKE